MGGKFLNYWFPARLCFNKTSGSDAISISKTLHQRGATLLQSPRPNHAVLLLLRVKLTATAQHGKTRPFKINNYIKEALFSYLFLLGITLFPLKQKYYTAKVAVVHDKQSYITHLRKRNKRPSFILNASLLHFLSLRVRLWLTCRSSRHPPPLSQTMNEASLGEWTSPAPLQVP